ESIYNTANASVLFHHIDPLKVFLQDNSLNEICINRPGEVWTESQAGWQRYEIPECDFLWCERFGMLVGNANRKTISSETPIMSASLPSGERTQVIFSPACPQKTVSITIRKPSFVDLSLEDLDSGGTFADVQMVSDELTDGEKEL
ncbi:P-type DNA transfer ATPase VirB11, partial [Comamonadaceae bacterium OH2310_COT-174]